MNGQDYRDIGNHNAQTKNLTVRWTHGHGTLEQATTCNTTRTYKGTTSPTSSQIWVTAYPWIPTTPTSRYCPCCTNHAHAYKGVDNASA